MKNYNKGFAKIDKVLSNTAKNYNLEGAMFKHKALKHWQEIAGMFIDGSESLTKAVDLQKGVLTVACLSREVASKIKLLANRIIESLNQLLGKRVVFAINVAM